MTSHEDYFMANPPMQPKLEIVRYVGSQGFKVPRTFENLEDALATLPDSQLLIRSEHPQDYDGASDLLYSGGFGGAVEHAAALGMSAQEYVDRIFSLPPNQNEGMSTFLGFGNDGYDGPNLVSASYWELIPDTAKVVITKDPARLDTLHVLHIEATPRGLEEKGYPAAHAKQSMRYELRGADGVEVCYGRGNMSPELEASVRSTVETYKDITTLSRFDPNHCYTAEFVIDQTGDPVFAQMHRGQDVQVTASSEISNEDFGPEWYTADMVIGKTTPNGQVSLIERAAYGVDLDDISIDRGKGNFVNRALGKIATEYIALHTGVYLHAQPAHFVLGESAGGHGSRSGLFRPPLSIIPPESFVNQENAFDRKAMTLEIISDGYTGKFRVIE